MSDSTSGRWIETWASDSRPGDLVRLPGDEDARQLVDRYYSTDAFRFVAVFPGGVREPLVKSSRLEIWDEDGSVARRIQTIVSDV